MGRAWITALVLGALVTGTLPAQRYFGDAYLVAGTGVAGRAEGTPMQSRLDQPEGLALDREAGLLYIADTGNRRICKVDLRQQSLSVLKQGGALKRPRRLFIQPSARRLLIEDTEAKVLFSLDLGGGSLARLLPLDAVGAGLTAWGPGSAPEELLVVEQAQSALYLIASGQAPRKIASLAAAEAAGLAGAALFVHLGRVYAVSPGASTARALALMDPDPAWVPPAEPAPLVELGGPATGLLPVRIKYNSVAGLIYWSGSENAFVFRRFDDGSRVKQTGWNMEGLTEIELAKGGRSFFSRPPVLAFDEAVGVLYAVDTPSHRVVAVPTRAWVTQLPEGYGILSPTMTEKVPGTRRVLAFGDSFAFFSDNLYARPETLIGARLQHYWNLFDMLEGRPGNREVIVSAMTLHHGADPISRAWEHHQALNDRYQPEDIVLFLNYNSLITLGTNFIYRAMPDDLVGPHDGEWAVLSEEEKWPQLGPEARKLYRIVRDAPGMYEIQTDGFMKPKGNAMRLFENPAYLKPFLSVFAKNLARLKALTDARGVRLWVLLLPVRNQLGQGELVHGVRNVDTVGIGEALDPALLQECAKVGVQAVALYQEAQQLAPAYFPMIMAQDDHYMRRTHDILGLMAGYRLSRLAAEHEARALPKRGAPTRRTEVQP